jgi:hypothetical protein
MPSLKALKSFKAFNAGGDSLIKSNFTVEPITFVELRARTISLVLIYAPTLTLSIF